MRVRKPGSALPISDSHLSRPAIARRFQPPSRRQPGKPCLLCGVAPDRVYSAPMFPWSGCALTAPFHPYLKNKAVSLCCTCPGVTPGGRYPLSLPYGARTFLTGQLSPLPRDCPTRSLQYCTQFRVQSQTLFSFACKISQNILKAVGKAISCAICAGVTHVNCADFSRQLR